MPVPLQISKYPDGVNPHISVVVWIYLEVKLRVSIAAGPQ